MSDEDYRQESASVLNDVRRKLYKDKEKAEALQKGAKNFIANALKSEKVKEALSREGLEVMKEGRAGRNSMRERGGFSSTFEGEVTGFEPRPWEED